MPRGRQQPESVMAWNATAKCGYDIDTAVRPPRVHTYNVPAPPTGPRVKMHADSSQVEAVLNPVRGIRDAQVRAGIKPTDHARHNVLAVKERSRLNALQRQAEAASDDVRPRPRNPVLRLSQQHRRSSSGSTGTEEVSMQQPYRDFLAENRAAAAAATRPVRATQAGAVATGGSSTPGAGGSGTDGMRLRHDFGQVPAYLLARKVELARQAAQRDAARQAALVPPGLRKLPEEERQNALRVLESSRREVEAGLSALPIVVDTPSQMRHKEQLERRLRELEEAHRVFSRPTVLVHDRGGSDTDADAATVSAPCSAPL